ncbi:MAG: LPP20 family lipoprotein [Nitrospira sp.]
MRGRYLAVTKANMLLSALMLLVVTPGLVFGESRHVVHATPDGMVDWTEKIATATGIGYAPQDPQMVPEIKDKMAREAAKGIALRNLLQVMKGIHIESTTTISNFIATNDEVRMKVEGLIQGAKYVETRRPKDGSYETTVTLDFSGEFSKLVIPKVAPQNTPLPQYQKKGQSVPISSYTGLVVDARRLGASGGVHPRLLTKQGDVVYSVAYVDQQAIPKGGIILYVSDPQTAQKSPRVTSKPLFITAERAQGSDLILKDSDAASIHGNPNHFQFLKEAKVLVILDPK